MKKFAVVLAGCGVYDGAEIHESVLTLLAIEKQGASYQVFAPDVDQYHVINHISGETVPEKRNVLTESARIGRGNARSMKEFEASAFDALIFPGGFGSVKNLSTWAIEGEKAKLNKDVEQAILAMHAAGKPVGAMCIAPVILSQVISGTKLTTGNDAASASFIKGKGSEYVTTTFGEVVVDREKKLFSTPCYMLDSNLVQIATGTENIVKAMMEAM